MISFWLIILRFQFWLIQNILEKHLVFWMPKSQVQRLHHISLIWCNVNHTWWNWNQVLSFHHKWNNNFKSVYFRPSRGWILPAFYRLSDLKNIFFCVFKKKVFEKFFLQRRVLFDKQDFKPRKKYCFNWN